MAGTASGIAAPQAKKFGNGDQQHVQAQRIWLILTAHVMKEWKWREEPQAPCRPEDVLITYGDLAKRMQMDPKAAIILVPPLTIIGNYCRFNDLPTLNSIVVNKKTGVPGDRVVVRDGKTFEDEQRDVMKTDWFAYHVPTTEALSKIEKMPEQGGAA